MVLASGLTRALLNIYQYVIVLLNGLDTLSFVVSAFGLARSGNLHKLCAYISKFLIRGTVIFPEPS